MKGKFNGFILEKPYLQAFKSTPLPIGYSYPLFLHVRSIVAFIQD